MIETFYLLPFNQKIIFFKIACYFLITTLSGWSTLNYLLPNKNLYIKLGGAIIFGQIIFLFLISLVSYPFKGHTGILISFGICLLYCLIVFLPKTLPKKQPFNQKKILSLTSKIVKIITVTPLKIFILGIFLSYILLFFSYGNVAILGGDVITHWGIANSFANGNYPTYSPWQPDFLTVYHQGTFMILGAISALTNAPIRTSHFIFIAVILTGIFVLLAGFVYQTTKKNNLLIFVPGILGFFAFGGPVLSVNLFNFFKAFFNSLINNNLLTIGSLDKFISLIGDYGSNSWGDFGAMYYVSFRTFGVAISLLIILFLKESFKKPNLLKWIFLVVLVWLLISVDESVFPGMAMLLGGYYFYLNLKNNMPLKKKVFQSGILILLSILLFFIFQNPIRDSLFNPKPEDTRFRLLTSDLPEFTARLELLQSKSNINQVVLGNDWFIPNFLIVLVICLLVLLFVGSYYSWAFFFLTMTTLIFSFVVFDIFGENNGRRITLSAFHFGIILIGFFCIELYIRVKNWQKIVVCGLIGLIFIPQLIVSHLSIAQRLVDGQDNQYFADLNNKQFILDWSRHFLPVRSRIIFFDGYPFDKTYSEFTLFGIQNYGLFIPIGPKDVKVLNAEQFGAYFDIMTSFSLQAIDEQKIDYVFISKNGLKFLPSNGRSMLGNKNIFEEIEQFDDGVMYKVNREGLDMNFKEVTLNSVIERIEDNKGIYLEKFKNLEIGRELLLRKSKTNPIFGPKENRNYFVHTEQLMPFNVVSFNPDLIRNLDYILSVPESSNNLFYEKYFKRIMENQFFVLWERS